MAVHFFIAFHDSVYDCTKVTLGNGGMGAVYRAWDMQFNAVCAVKENFEATPEAQLQFMREANLLHNLRHPNLPLVTDHFIIPTQGQYLVMDYIEGDDLQTVLDNARAPLPEAQVVTPGFSPQEQYDATMTTEPAVTFTRWARRSIT